ncbi:MAG: helix-turn-helix domain-containing protein [Bacteroidota bacterium]
MTTYVSSIAEFAALFDYPRPKYPTLALVEVEKVREKAASIPQALSFGFYTIGLKKNLKGYLKYGRKIYDFQEGVLVFSGPRQVISYENLILDKSEGWYLFFERSFLSNTSLESNIERYSFFDYEVNEALHLSREEEEHMQRVFSSLFKEYNSSIDSLSKKILLNHLESILMYSERYYKRQFITRNDADSDFLTRFEKILNQNSSLEQLESKGIPSVKEIAYQMHLSPSYLSDALRSASGLSAQKHIHLRLLSLAKEQLLHKDQAVSEVAYKLGFESPSYFSRLFKKVEGVSPSEYIKMN